MIPACKDSPAPVATRVQGAPRAMPKEQSSSFDDALRESGCEPTGEKAEPAQEACAETPPKKTGDADGGAQSAQAPAPQGNPQPVGLEALLAQVLPSPQQPSSEPAAEPSPAGVEASAKLPSAALAQALAATPRDLKASERAAQTAPALAPDADTAIPARAPDIVRPEDEDAGPGAATADSPEGVATARPPAAGDAKFVPAPSQGGERGGAGKQDDGDAGADAGFRPVAVRQVSSTTHFPVVADPVRQIATEVTRALGEPAAAPGSAAPTDPSTPQPVKTLQVQLEPEALGTVTLRLRLTGNHLSVRVDVAEPATLDMIQREHDRLQKSMTSDHVSIDRLEIRPLAQSAPVQNSESAGAPKQDMNAQQGQQQRPQAEAGGGRGQDSRRQQQDTGAFRNDRQDTASNRSSDSRGLYL